jgi:hypothetical protein
MKKLLLTSLFLFLAAMAIQAQTYKTRDGNIYFNPNKDQGNREYSALSKEATAVLKVETAEVALLVPMKSFHFNNALLEEHFNENYLHTDKYPNGTYKGKLIGFTKDMPGNPYRQWGCGHLQMPVQDQGGRSQHRDPRPGQAQTDGIYAARCDDRLQDELR